MDYSSERAAVCDARHRGVCGEAAFGSQLSVFSGSPSSYLSHQDKRPNSVPVFLSQKVAHELGTPIVRDVFFLLVLWTNVVVNMVAQFVIKHAPKAELSAGGKSEKKPWIRIERLVDTNLDPGWSALPFLVVETENL